MNLDKAFGIHAQALQLRGQRAEILAANMANADTPNYKAKDFNFHASLMRSKDELEGMKRTHDKHLHAGPAKTGHMPLQYRIPNQPSLDGNTVDTQLERSEFMQNSIMYQTSLRFLNGKISGLLRAIKGE